MYFFFISPLIPRGLQDHLAADSTCINPYKVRDVPACYNIIYYILVNTIMLKPNYFIKRIKYM